MANAKGKRKKRNFQPTLCYHFATILEKDFHCFHGATTVKALKKA